MSDPLTLELESAIPRRDNPPCYDCHTPELCAHLHAIHMCVEGCVHDVRWWRGDQQDYDNSKRDEDLPAGMEKQ